MGSFVFFKVMSVLLENGI